MSLIIVIAFIITSSLYLAAFFINAIKKDIEKQHEEIRKAIKDMYK